MSPSSSPQPAEEIRSTRGRPPRLDQARTVEAALQLLDESGLEALTMRRLADAVGAQAGALYRYFATKQDLLTAMAERMLADCSRPPACTDWSGQLADLTRRLRAALLAHRDGARVYAGTHATGGNTLGFADTLVGVLRDAGFTADDAARAALAIVHFTVGHTLEEQAATQASNEEPADPERLRQAVTSGDYPHLAAALPVLTSSDFTAHFEFGLRLLTGGLHDLDREER